MPTQTYTFPITKTTHSKLSYFDWDHLHFGKDFSDHMFLMEYKDGEWSQGEIVPFENISMHPAMSAIHYGQSIFEGMKAYRTTNDDILLFRPEMNAKRFAESATRMCMPPVDEELFVEAIRQLISLDAEWVTKRRGHSLYIRPFMFATDELIGIRPSETYKFMIITSPVGQYYSEPLNVKIETSYTRAANGGVGRAKAAGKVSAAGEYRKFINMMKKKTKAKNENITIPIKVGDTVLGGKFKNKRIVVKSIGKNDKGDITINGRPLLKFRIVKEGIEVEFPKDMPMDENSYLKNAQSRLKKVYKHLIT